MALARWEADRRRREAAAKLTPERCQNRIVRRIVVVFDEQRVKEAVIWDWDSNREARRKVKEVLSE